MYYFFEIFCIALASYKHIDLQWTPAALMVIKSSSTVNFNLQLVSPDCSLPLPHSTKWFAQQSIPIVLMMIYLVVYLPFYLLGLCWQRKSWKLVIPQMKGTFLTILNLCYFSVASSTLSVFDCRLNGVKYSLSSEPSIICSMDDPEYSKMLFPALLCLGIYVAGIPLLFSILLFSNRKLIIEDQIRYFAGRSSEGTGLSNDPASRKLVHYEKNAISVQYGFLYRQYKPQKVCMCALQIFHLYTYL
jgi:hypothetical protein